MESLTGRIRLPWFIPGVIGLSLCLSFLPGWAEFLQYDRAGAGSGQFWRPITGQLVHWSPRMTLLDLGVLAISGIWLELRSRWLAVGIVLLAGCMVAAAIHFLAVNVTIYRGSSGVATATVTALALLITFDRRNSRMLRVLGLLSVLLLGAKLILETTYGTVIEVGQLPEGIRLAAVAHQFGALAGFVSAATWLVASSRMQGRGETPDR